MREIDKKLIEAIQNEKPVEEIKKLIDEGADVNVEIKIEYEEEYSLDNMKKKVKLVHPMEYILENLFEKIIEYNEEKQLKIPDKKIESEILVDIFIYMELEKHISKILYYLQLLKMISQNKYFKPNENVLEKLIRCEIAMILRPIISITIQKLDLVKNKTILIDAIIRNVHPDIIKLMIESGVDINFIDEYGLTPVIYAFIKDRSKIIGVLKKYNEIENKMIEKLIKNFLVNFFKGKNISLILLINDNNSREMVSNLIFNANAYGLNLNNVINDERIIFLFLELRLLKDLIERNLLKVNYSINKKTLLELVIKEQKFNIAKFLIQKGANVNIILENGKSLLEFAEILKDKELINLIKSSPTFKSSDHNPKRLVKILTNFRKDSPIKYTTHLWDGEERKKYGNFDCFMRQVKNQWDKIEEELKELSPNLHKKINLFLFQKDNNPWSSVEGDKLSIGWSNLKGLDEWCNNNKEPFEFELDKIYKVEGKSVTKFGDVVNVFKREIQIRSEKPYLKNIFIEFRNKLYKEAKIKLEIKNLKNQDFYTDVEVFKKVLNRIFSEMLKRENCPKIIIESRNDNEEYFELAIIQVDSFSNQSPEYMLKKADGGDFGDIKKNLKNLCDWSIENKTADNKSYRINYLISKPVERIEYLDENIKGFTHILRFYK